MVDRGVRRARAGECGFDWVDRARASVRSRSRSRRCPVPVRRAARLGATGDEVAAPVASWSAKAVRVPRRRQPRVFAERLEGVGRCADRLRRRTCRGRWVDATLVGYDQDELAVAPALRGRCRCSRRCGRCGNARAAWVRRHAYALARPTDVPCTPSAAMLNAAEITRAPAHDAVHHCWDVSAASARVIAATMSRRSSSSSVL